MRLALGSRALHRDNLPTPFVRDSGYTVGRDVGLRNPASSDPVWEKGDTIFWERYHATTGFLSNTDADEFFPINNFFLDIAKLFGDMTLSDVAANGTPSNACLVDRGSSDFLPSSHFYLRDVVC
jgi:hypothetical protein